MLEPGTKVKVVNPNHWLFDKRGYVVKPSLESNMKRIEAGISRQSVAIPVDFGKRLHGWMKSPLKGERRVVTHDCDGSIRKPTGYYMLEGELQIEDVPSTMKLSRDGVGK